MVHVVRGECITDASLMFRQRMCGYHRKYFTVLGVHKMLSNQKPSTADMTLGDLPLGETPVTGDRPHRQNAPASFAQPSRTNILARGIRVRPLGKQASAKRVAVGSIQNIRQVMPLFTLKKYPKVGDIVLARLEPHPPWPAYVGVIISSAVRQATYPFIIDCIGLRPSRSPH